MSLINGNSADPEVVLQHTLGGTGESCNRGRRSFAVLEMSDLVLLRNRNAIGVVVCGGLPSTEMKRIAMRGRTGY